MVQGAQAQKARKSSTRYLERAQALELDRCGFKSKFPISHFYDCGQITFLNYVSDFSSEISHLYTGILLLNLQEFFCEDKK